MREDTCVVMVCFLVDVGLQELERECKDFEGCQFATSTRQTHRIQLDAFFRFCQQFGLEPSCTDSIICLFMTFLARKICFTSIRQYVSAVNGYFLSQLRIGVDYDSFRYKACLAGIKRTLGDRGIQAPPILPQHLLRMFANMELTSDNIAVRAAVLLSFRALLRQSHVTDSSSVLRRKDIIFNEHGLIINIRKSKTIQFGERVLSVPIKSLKNSALCAVYWTRKHFLDITAAPDAQAFRIQLVGESSPLTYAFYLASIRILAAHAGLNPKKFSTHSLRRGGATFFRNCGISVQNIQIRGDWSSSAVYKYLDTSVKDLLKVDSKVAEFLDNVG